RRWLMVAKKNHDEVTIGVRPQISRQGLVRVRKRPDVTRREIHPVGLEVESTFHLCDRVRLVGQQSTPVRLIGRRWPEWRVRADGRKEYEKGRPRLPAHFEAIELAERVLIRNIEPAEWRPRIGKAGAAVDLIESIEPSFRPLLPEPRHQRDGPIAPS